MFQSDRFSFSWKISREMWAERLCVIKPIGLLRTFNLPSCSHCLPATVFNQSWSQLNDEVLRFSFTWKERLKKWNFQCSRSLMMTCSHFMQLVMLGELKRLCDVREMCLYLTALKNLQIWNFIESFQLCLLLCYGFVLPCELAVCTLASEALQSHSLLSLVWRCCGLSWEFLLPSSKHCFIHSSKALRNK